ncbi:type II toxin-antitoxin system RelE/ParE family toxin [Ottowia sp.]|jgi:putative addiction module killer protein|uniref:type II toxin-antitoxin system RelE/ParE family toxin n=1 Tax=Ottowia sp. TaxID=1898956 RepID=UPI0025E0A90C|nr:type II toxin-antitoxin system RelE/ParE family toxin [Ottowia sp.]MBK6614179.1 type II toxin-antitoxin system RelE/ParE family toxin [Ottowia sp.]
MNAYKIEHYLTADEHRDIYQDWLRHLRDSQAKVAVIRRVARVELGNFGDHKFCRDGVWELRIDLGPGYRVYYALSGHRVVLLLCGGNKRTQDADIDRAAGYWQDWQRRLDDEKQIP